MQEQDLSDADLARHGADLKDCLKRRLIDKFWPFGKFGERTRPKRKKWPKDWKKKMLKELPGVNPLWIL